MATPATHEESEWAIDCATSLPEVWALVAAFSGLVGAWRLMSVCRTARAGAKHWLAGDPAGRGSVRWVYCG